MVAVARSRNVNRSTIGTTLKSKTSAGGVWRPAVHTVLSVTLQRRGKAIEETEKLLSMWLQDQHPRLAPLSFMLI